VPENYQEVEDGKTHHTFEEAKTACLDLGFALATATTLTALKELQNIATANVGSHYWMGLKAAEGKWMWEAPPPKPLKFKKWMTGQPDNAPNYEHCGMVSSSDFKWNDLNCDQILDSYVLCAARDEGIPVEYFLSDDKMVFNFWEAQAYCNERGMTLATFMNESENRKAQQAGKDAFAHDMSFWIYLYDQKQSNTTVNPDREFRWNSVDSVTKRNVMTPAQCKLICEEDYRCNYFNWKQADSTCTLMGAVESDAGTQRTGVVAGKGDCSYDGSRVARSMAARSVTDLPDPVSEDESPRDLEASREDLLRLLREARSMGGKGESWEWLKFENRH